MLTKPGNIFSPPQKQVPASKLTPAQLAQRVLDETGGDRIQAVRLAGRYARGARLRATIAMIGSTLLRRSAS